MKAVVTGCAGFIGSHLAEALLADGHEVLGIDNLSRGTRGWVDPAVDFRLADIRGEDAAKLLDGADWVFHTAAVAVTPQAVRDPAECNSVNVAGTVNLLEAARRAGVRRFVNSSSNVVYAKFTPYWVSKEAAENYGRVYASLYGLSVMSLRYSNVFGSLRSNPENCVMSLRTSARERGYVEVTGDGTQSRDFTNVADICRANLAAARSDSTDVADICTGENHAVGEIAARFGVPVRHTTDRPGDVKHIVQDPGPARDLLGFTARVPFETGLAVYL